ncbi:MAG TPA: ATP-binding protein [Gaiellaceae bacterium]|nr:ATP-binding protein [Gaiellaceae bacterium]
MPSFHRLHLRFALATLAVIAAAGGALLWAVKREEVRQAESNVAAHAVYVEQSILRDELEPADLAKPVTGARRAQLDWLFDSRVLNGGGLRVKLYRASDGRVTYSNVHSLIGTPNDDLDEFHSVLAGRIVRDVTHLNHEGGTGKNVKALEVYVPLTLRGHSSPSGVFEIYQSYGPVAASIHRFDMPFTLLALATLLLLWGALFPLVSRMGRALERTRLAHRTTEQALEETAHQLRQAQKMEAIGRLAGGVAHDFNNLLLAINGYSELLASGLTDANQQRYAREILAAGERAAGLTSQLLAFSRRQVLQPRILNLNECIVEIESMLRRLIGEGVRVELDLDRSLRAVEADPSQIGQVLLNLAVNARDAMEGAGTLRIATRNTAGDVVLEVTDTGVGMNAATQAQIFEPFFTTKAVGEGTGLGLATVYGIVTQSGGAIDVRSAPGEGATFTLRFPATESESDDVTVSDVVPARGRERILVVDDEAVVRELVAQLLRGLGYDVTVAASAREARTLGSDFDLLLTDVVMPETDGPSLARTIDVEHVLFMSGYAQEGLTHGGAPFLQKPFGREELARAVRELLDAGRIARSAA